MKEQNPERLRTLDRGLAIVEFLSCNGPTPLAGLRKATGLANATLLRLLFTLQERGWVRRNIAEGQYELAHSLGDLLGAKARAHPLAELAAPILLELRPLQLGLPTDLGTPVAPGKMEIIESTRQRGPLAPVRTGLGLRPSMVFSAHGRAGLAFAPQAEAAAHLTQLRRFASKRELHWLNSGKLKRELERTRERGFGLREPDYWEIFATEPGPNLGALAVPILSSSGWHGTISLLWLSDDTSLEEVVAQGALADLRAAAQKLSAMLDRAGMAAPRFAATG